MPTSPRRTLLPRIGSWMLVPMLLVCVFATLAGTAPGATSSTVVGATVASATNLDAAGCGSNAAGRTHFGTVLPGSSVTTSMDCVVVFGSSNDTARLRIGQSDQRGNGMFQPTRGALDTGFSGDGRLTLAHAPTDGYDRGHGGIVQPDGFLVTITDCAMGGATGDDVCVARRDEAGAMDPTFGGGDGLVVLSSPGAGAVTQQARTVAQQPDGKLVIGGFCSGIGACVWRLETNGDLDVTFDSDGAALVGAGTIEGLAVLDDGRIRGGGGCSPSTCAFSLRADGSPDPTFGGGDGLVTHDFDSYENMADVAVSTAGIIVFGGECLGGGTIDFCVARLTLDGSPDPAFSGDGFVTTDISTGQYDGAKGVAAQADGSVVASGDCYVNSTGTYATCLTRLDATGALDPTFNADGRYIAAASAPGANDMINDVLVQPDGAVVSVGRCSQAPGYDLCLVRLTRAGELDPAFSQDGVATVAIAPSFGGDTAFAVVPGVDGELGVVGDCYMGATTGSDTCVAWLAPGGTISQYQPGVADWAVPDASLFATCLRSVSAATPVAAPNATCPTGTATAWNALPAAPALVATANADTVTATASFRFGLRTADAQPPGSYVAPIDFTVVAP